MTYQRLGRCRRHIVASTALLATIATATSFLAPVMPRAIAEDATTTTTTSSTTTTAVPGSNCSATLAGSALDRSKWVASSNASSSSADAPTNALDGNYSTRFSTNELQATGLYFEVNMGSAQNFNELKMSDPNSPNDYARSYDVEVSNNASSWTTVATCTGTGTPETVSFPMQTAQYVKVVLTGGSARYWWSIDEFDLFGPPPPPTTTTTTVAPTTTTTAVPGSNCSATLAGSALDRSKWVASSNASSSSADAPTNALDGNYSTRFSTNELQATGLYFEVNMGSAQNFNELKMSDPNSPNDYARSYDVEVSNNASSWTTVATCTGTGTPETVSFPMQTAEYVKVVLTGGSARYWWSIDEFDLFGPPPPPTTTTTTVAPTTTTTVRPSPRHSCLQSWPKLLVKGTLIGTHNGFYVVIFPCSARRVLGVRVLEGYRVFKQGRHQRVEPRWSTRFRLGSPMGRRLIEFQVSGHEWIRWNGRLYRVGDLAAI